MNAIGGFVPSSGRIEVLGRDVSGLPPYRRARLGLGRGFQAARLYDDLTVRETVLAAAGSAGTDGRRGVDVRASAVDIARTVEAP